MNFSDLKFISKIGGGSGGQVFKARYVTETVAVKQVFSSMMDENNLGEDSRLPLCFSTLVLQYPCFSTLGTFVLVVCGRELVLLTSRNAPSPPHSTPPHE